MTNVVNVFISDIEKNFRGHLPQNCINLLAMMAEQSLMLEKMLNQQQQVLMQVAQSLVISSQADAALLKVMKKHNDKFTDPNADLVKNEELKDD